MANFNETLKIYIKNSGYTISEFASKCNIDRAWLSNVMSGRKELSNSKFENIINSNLLDDKQIEVLKKLYVEKDFSDQEVERINYLINRSSRQSRRDDCIIPVDIDLEQRMQLGKINSLSALYALLSNSDEYTFIYTNIPASMEEAIDVIYHFVELDANQSKDYKHIFFSNDGEDTHNMNTFLTICDLAELGFSGFSVISDINVENIETNDFFPYFLVTDKAMILFDSACSNAIVTFDEGIINIHIQKFVKLYDTGKKPIVQFDDAVELMRSLTVLHDSSSEFSITPDFCVTPLLDYDILASNAAPDLPNKEFLIQAVLNHYDMDYSEFSNFITIDSINRFAETGTIYEIPRTYLRPLNMNSRIKLLKKIGDNIKNAKYYKSYILNPTKIEYNLFDVQLEKIGVVGICGQRKKNRNNDLCFNGEWLFTIADETFYKDFINLKEYLVSNLYVYSDDFAYKYVNNLVKELEAQYEADKNDRA